MGVQAGHIGRCETTELLGLAWDKAGVNRDVPAIIRAVAEWPVKDIKMYSFILVKICPVLILKGTLMCI